MIKPTVGRVVWYRPAGRPDFAEPLLALICRVWSDTCVNLVAFDENGAQLPGTTSVLLLQDGNDRPTGGGFCEWMPYQKGQAARTEALEQAAGQLPAAAS